MHFWTEWVGTNGVPQGLQTALNGTGRAELRPAQNTHAPVQIGACQDIFIGYVGRAG